MKKTAFIGFGKMGGALAAGALRTGALHASMAGFYDPSPQAKAAGRKLSLRFFRAPADAAAWADVIVLAVKPQQMAEALPTLRDAVAERRDKPVFVSIAAGVTIGRLQRDLGVKGGVIRVMPNTPAMLGAGMSAVAYGKGVSPEDKTFVLDLVAAVGRVIVVKEAAMNAVTAVSGSGPAYAFFLAEAMIEAGISLGLTKTDAEVLARQTIFGAGRLLVERREAVPELRRQVTSPGGTTAAAVEVLDAQHVRPAIIRAIKRAAERGRELSKAS